MQDEGAAKARLIWRKYVALSFMLWVRQCESAIFFAETTSTVSTQTKDLCHGSEDDISYVISSSFEQHLREWQGAHQRHAFKDLSKIYEYPLIVPSLSIQQGLSSLGNTWRLERFLKKLVLGQPVKVTALGGSVSVGHGVTDKKNSYVTRFFTWINETFPHPNHQFLNSAIPGITSAYVAPCVLNLVLDDPDFVLLEFTFNDGEKEESSNFVDPIRTGLEHLVRKLMTMPSSPAVIAYHYHPLLRSPFDKFWTGSENTMDMLFRYYGITSISFRSALHQLLANEPESTKQIWRPDDTAHPSCVGHKFMADILIGIMQDFLAHIITSNAPTHESHTFNEIPKPLLSANNPSEERVDKCFLGENFKALATSLQGYDWIDEVKKPGRKKFGFVSYIPGESMTIKVPLESVVHHLKGRTALIALGSLESYEHMGWLRITCSKGCSCPETEYDNHKIWPAYSLTYWKPVLVVLDEGRQVCELKIETMKKTSSGEHKIKLSSLMVSSEQQFNVGH